MELLERYGMPVEIEENGDTKAIKEVYDELKAKLRECGCLPEEYFMLGFDVETWKALKPTDPFPEYRFIACYPVSGISEGHYIHCDVIYARENGVEIRNIFLGKTFLGIEKAMEYANAIAYFMQV